MSFFGGGRSQAPSAAPSTQTQFVREAPGIEERKIELMDIARQVAQDPINLPDYQVAGLGALEQQGITAAGTTGVGVPTVQQGIGQVTGAAQTAAQGPNINQFLNPYQQYVTNEIARQSGQLGLGQQQMAQGDINQLMASGGVQRQLAQSALDAQRQSTLQQQYEPYQRAEFLANLYAAGPKSSSQVTMGTQPSTSPLAQAVGTGIGAFTAFQNVKQPGQA